MTFNVTRGTAASDLVDSVNLWNNGTGLILTGSGILQLTATNTYTSGTTISGGTLELGNGRSGSDGSINSTSGVTDNAALAYNLFGPTTTVSEYGISGGGSVAGSARAS